MTSPLEDRVFVLGECLAAVQLLERVRALASAQADDLSLWFPMGNPGTQLEQLQLALRRMHGLIEGEPTPWLEDRKDGGT